MVGLLIRNSPAIARLKASYSAMLSPFLVGSVLMAIPFASAIISDSKPY